jgi:hypothetical protein
MEAAAFEGARRPQRRAAGQPSTCLKLVRAGVVRVGPLAPVVPPGDDALQLGPPALKGFPLGTMWPVRSLKQLAALANQPLEMTLGLLAGFDVQSVWMDRFGAHAEPYRTGGELSPAAEDRTRNSAGPARMFPRQHSPVRAASSRAAFARTRTPPSRATPALSALRTGSCAAPNAAAAGAFRRVAEPWARRGLFGDFHMRASPRGFFALTRTSI